jgi:hypothetical protein
MIMSVTQGKGMRGCLGYAIEGKVVPGKAQEKGRKQQDRDPQKDVSRTVSYAYNPAKDAVILDHNLARQPRGRETSRSLASEMLTVKRPGTRDPVAHFFIRFHKNDLATKDPATLRSLTREAMERFSPGLTQGHQYVATLHDAHSRDPHVHVVVNRVPVVSKYHNRRGKMTPTPTLNMWQSKARCLDICESMELAHPNLMRHLSRDNELPKYIREKAGVYRGQQRDIAAGKPARPSPRKQMFDAVIPAVKDTRATDWQSLGSLLKEQGVTVKTRQDRNGITRGVRFVDKTGKEWKPKEIHSKLKFKTIEKVLNRHHDKAQRIAEAKARQDLAKDLGLDKLHIEGLAEMRAARANVDDAGKRLAKLEELKKVLGGGEKKLYELEKKQEEKEKDQGKGKENERSAWTYRGPDLDGR